jgi:uncharacterized protein (DUF885 family)
MKLRTSAVALAAVVVLSCASAPPPPPVAPPLPGVAPAPAQGALAPSALAANADDAAVDAAERAYMDLLVAIAPEYATSIGIHTHDAELDDYTAAGFDASIAQQEKMLTALKAQFASPRVSVGKKVDLELLMHSLEVAVRVGRELQPDVRSPQSYLAPLGSIFLMIARPYAPAEDRAHAVVARLEKIPDVIAAAKANLKNPPRVWTETAIESTHEAYTFLAQVHAFLEPTLPHDSARVTQALQTAHAAFADYEQFLKKDLLPRSKGDFAAGRPLFDFMLHQSYFLDEDADAVLALGQKLFDATDAQMTELAKKIDPKAKGWPEVAKRAKAKHPTAEDLIPSYKRELDRARAFLVAKDAVPMPPNDDCEVIETPPFERATITAAYDPAPAFDTGTTKGFFFVTPIEPSMSAKEKEQMLRENAHAEQVDTVVHETYPGHHLQLSFSRRHPSIIRKMSATSLFDEGWALYSEELMSELGYYTDEERLIQLEWTLVRAARVIIDVGLHTKGMTFDQAVAILTDKVHLERALALSEVKRYTSDPTQPLAYIVGREKIFALREKYKARDPEHFTLKRFHEDLLSHGTIVPALIAEEMFASK